jgi:hypothetical protein
MISLHKDALAWLPFAIVLTQSGCGLIAGLREYDVEQQGGPEEPACKPSAEMGDDGKPVLIAEQRDLPRAIAVADERYVFWANEKTQELWRMDLKACGAPELVTTTAPRVITSLAVDASDVYWTASVPYVDKTECQSEPASQFARAPRDSIGIMPDGGMADILWEGSSCIGADGLFVNANTLYWTAPGYTSDTYDQNSACQLPKNGSVSPACAIGQHGATSIWVDASRAYWVARIDGAVRFAETTNFNSAQQFSDGTGALALTGDATTIYWITKDGRVLSRQKAAQEAKALVSNQGQITSLAVDDGYVYFTAPSVGQIRRVPLAGGEPEIVVDDSETDPERLVMDKTRLYWTAYNSGKVFWMKKP